MKILKLVLDRTHRVSIYFELNLLEKKFFSPNLGNPSIVRGLMETALVIFERPNQ